MQSGVQPILVSERMARQLLDLGRTTLLSLAYSGELPSIKVGRRRLFEVEALRRWAKEQSEGKTKASSNDAVALAR